MVGKTGLAIRYTVTFEPTVSTDAAGSLQLLAASENEGGLERQCGFGTSAGKPTIGSFISCSWTRPH